MDEVKLVAAILSDREAYDALAGRLDPMDFGEQASVILRCGVQQYKRDPSAVSVDRDVLESAISRMFANAKHAEAALNWLADVPEKVSTINVTTEYRLLRRERIGLNLAAKLGSGEHDDEVFNLIRKYEELSVEQKDESEKFSYEELAADLEKGAKIRLYPSHLNRQVGGGCLRGHNLTIFGRPESGKTLFAINLAAGFLRQGLRVLYTGNEEPARDIQRRMLSCMSGIPVESVGRKPEALRKAITKAEELGYNGLVCKDLTSGRIPEVEALVRKFKPDVIIIDQLKNLQMPGSGNHALELDQVAREVRRLGKQYEAVTVSVTQAGDSGENKLKLGMGDIDWSNTGIPGAADLLIGVGVNDPYDAQRRRLINLPKNKLNGKHSTFPIFIEPEVQLIRSKPRRKT